MAAATAHRAQGSRQRGEQRQIDALAQTGHHQLSRALRARGCRRALHSATLRTAARNRNPDPPKPAHLSHSYDAEDLALHVAPAGRIEQNLNSVAVLVEERELEVGSLDAVQRVVQHALHRVAVLELDEVGHQMLAHRLSLVVPHDHGSLLVPLVDITWRHDVRCDARDAN